MSHPTLLLDLDGTLTDPQVGIVASLRHAFLALGHEPPDHAALRDHIGTPLGQVFAEELGAAPDSERVRTAIAHYRERFDARGWRENRVYPEIPAFLDAACAAGWRCLVATSKPTVFAERIALHFGLREKLDGVYGSELDGRLGAKPELLRHVVAAEGIDPAHSVMVGDRRHDVAGALANRIASVGVLWGYGSAEELREAGAHVLCDQPGALLSAAASLVGAASPS